MAGDLTQQLSKFMDRHLVFPLLEYLSNKHLYNDDDIQKAKISLLSATNMVDYAMDIHQTLYNAEEPPQEMKDRRTTVCPPFPLHSRHHHHRSPIKSRSI